MNFEEKIKEKFLYSTKLNIIKIIYFTFQFLKSKNKLKKSYSNWGIDMMADFYFRDKKKGIYIDVGCHHSFLNNNTYPLYKRGWNGINIDIDFNTIDSFNFFRKNDHNMQVAVSDKIGEADLFFFHNRAAKNTLCKDNGNNAKEIKKVRTNTLNNIIADSKFSKNFIDFISIDVEGHELNVLKGFDFKKYKPKLVVLELIQPEIKEFFHQKINNVLKSNIYLHMLEQDYKMINWIHDDLIFVPNNLDTKNLS
tara:strand:- start:84 stop:839 length:756 start_codon:yes stop_codon:yes gene_type:complete